MMARQVGPTDVSRASEKLPLRIAISTRALFDLETEHTVFEKEGLEAYLRASSALEDTQLGRGPAFAAVSRLLALNAPGAPARVQAVLLSRNAPDTSLRVFAAIRDRGLDIATGSFTGGRTVAPFLKAWSVDLLLSREPQDVEAASAAGVAAAQLGSLPAMEPQGDTELRVAFDGDAVVFSDEADRIFARDGLEAFLQHEVAKAAEPLPFGPFAKVLLKLAALRDNCRATGSPARVRLALVTARTAPAHARVVRTLRTWGVEFDEAHFVGEGDKASILAAFGAHIFFDDQDRHIEAASLLVPSGRVPGRSGLAGRAAKAG